MTEFRDLSQETKFRPNKRSYYRRVSGNRTNPLFLATTSEALHCGLLEPIWWEFIKTWERSSNFIIFSLMKLILKWIKSYLPLTHSLRMMPWGIPRHNPHYASRHSRGFSDMIPQGIIFRNLELESVTCLSLSSKSCLKLNLETGPRRPQQGHMTS